MRSRRPSTPTLRNSNSDRKATAGAPWYLRMLLSHAVDRSTALAMAGAVPFKKLAAMPGYENLHYSVGRPKGRIPRPPKDGLKCGDFRSEEHTSELQSP